MALNPNPLIDNKAHVDVRELRVLSYNVGLLSFKLCGCCEVFANPPYKNQRMPYILKNFSDMAPDLDIICIQECYDDRDADCIYDSVKGYLPFMARGGTQGQNCLQFHNGLAIFSRFAISNVRIDKLKDVASLERYLASKANLVCDVTVPGAGIYTIVAMHTTAGGATHPEHGDVDVDRESELIQAWERCEQSLTEGNQAIILGDLNCGPEASAANYNFILNKGFRDTYLEAPSPVSPAFTWDPANYLNKIGPHAECPGQRCDHLLVHETAPWKVKHVKVVFTEEVVPVTGKIMSTMSDHYGLLVHLTK
ncbi:hypothetical protein EON64_16800, partial [archaeon]